MGIFFSKTYTCLNCSKKYIPRRDWHIYCKKCFKQYLRESYNQNPFHNRLCICGKGIKLCCIKCQNAALCCTYCLENSAYNLHYCKDCI